MMSTERTTHGTCRVAGPAGPGLCSKRVFSMLDSGPREADLFSKKNMRLIWADPTASAGELATGMYAEQQRLTDRS